MDNVALGVKVFKRPHDLERLLESVPSNQFDQIYIADDGDDDPAETALMNTDIDTDTTILNLEYDAGNGYARREIVEALREEYLLMVDADHTLPSNLNTLYQQLNSKNEIGGVAGSIVEPKSNRVWQSGKNFFEKNDGLVRDADGHHDVQIVEGDPFVRFDFVPQAVMFKSECLADYSWDRQFTTRREHIDFFVGHWKLTDWEFAISPGVFFGHYPGGDHDYKSHRRSKEKHKRDDEYFLEKWEYDFIKMNDPYWFSSGCSSISIDQRIQDIYTSQGFKGLIYKGYDVVNSILK